MNLLYGIIIPNNCFMPWEAVWSWIKAPKFPTIYAQGADLDLNKNLVWKQFLMYNKTTPAHLLLIDYDIVFKPEDVLKIKEHLDNGLDVVAGVYPMGNPPYSPFVFERIEKDYKLCPLKEGLNQVDACGGGFMGINYKIIDKLPENPFEDMPEGNIHHGEDISFCHRVNELGMKVWLDSSIKVGQVRTQVIY
jgi:hypothetical protein